MLVKLGVLFSFITIVKLFISHCWRVKLWHVDVKWDIGGEVLKTSSGELLGLGEELSL